ncbi:LPS export ABC transporter permease LptF [Amphiplicatus metriothermophilus]|uniref:Lipopolysaccharide export system permease protein n=1 Tax=Amphiplicatus metriothermophilus TaxID=1519374 RepID=A0A239PYS9_9PROT|nr:LPS export ABC transporter permease LptF [Amphiplicatus metriothermophilus]MBB5519790.1 lipopolysaccharide export system permease protein [Amphiplicatus metriothermophilus]SNT75183.1 lipopolysaccharide export system permease protein [Amphiplicatus metriothermophilus]
MTRLDRYIFRQCLTPFLYALGIATVIVWMTQSLQRADLLVDYHQSLGVFARLSALILPSLLAIILPFALFAAALYALQRLHADSEIAVMFAAGVSRFRIAAPLLLLAFACALATLWINLDLMPRTYRQLKQEIAQIRADFASAVLRSGEFVSVGEGLTIYVDEARPGGQFVGLLIHDYRDPDSPRAYMARRGVLRDTDAGPVLYLAEGNVQRAPSDGGAIEITRFDETAINVSRFNPRSASLQLEMTERYLPELLRPDLSKPWDRMNAAALIAEGHNRLAAPLYAFVYVLIALYALIGGPYNRRGYALRILAACAAAGAARVGGFLAQSLAAATGAWWAIHAAPLLMIAVMAVLLADLRRFHAASQAGAA